MQNKKSVREYEKNEALFKRIVICSFVGAFIYFVILILFSYAELKMSFGAGTYFTAGIIAALLSSLIAGFICVIKTKKNVVFSGAVSGALIGFISDIILFVISRESGLGLLYVFLSSLAGGIAGAVIAANVRIKNKY